MVQSFTITSDYGNAHLADIRTDGTNISWVSDSTSGKLAISCKNNFKLLKQMADKSSHLKLIPSEETIGIYRFILTHGDVAEITIDNVTHILNGTILNEEQSMALDNMIQSGQVQVTQRADLNSPIQVHTSHPRPKTQAESKNKPSEAERNAIIKKRKEREYQDSLNNSRHDQSIEDMKFGTDEEDAFGRRLMYLLRYGGE
jgi:hypothetical protein